MKTQPTGPAQTCQVSGGSGTVGAADVTSVSVNCAVSTYTVGGTVTGLVGTGLVLENSGADDLSVTGNGSFAFATPVASGQAFAVTIKAQPGTPAQVCSVSQGDGHRGQREHHVGGGRLRDEKLPGGRHRDRAGRRRG